ncbi:MAG: hypothetical protein ACN23H_00460 [Candidatus Phytoplasma vitis]|nr:MAG: hypothetical protein M6G77_02735 [Candidatus Phytoplasma vitis]
MEQKLFLEQLTINKDNLKLSFNDNKMFHLINNNNKTLNYFELKKIKKQFQNNLFFLKNTDYSNEYFKKLGDKQLKKIYKNIYLFIDYNKENHICPKTFNINSKIIDIKKHIRENKNNTRYKFILNFSNENKISCLNLTLSHHNNDRTLSKEVKYLITIKKLVKIFMQKLKYNYSKYLKQKKFNKEKKGKYLKKFKYFNLLNYKEKIIGMFGIFILCLILIY